MSPSPVLDAANLPDAAVPFVRELVLEILRRAPANLGSPPRFAAQELDDPRRCAHSARSLVQWFGTVPDTLGRRMEELEAVFCSLLDLVQGLDGRVRRAVLQARSRAEEESTFVTTLHEVLQGLRASLAPEQRAGHMEELLDEVLRRIESRDTNGGAGRMEISAHFDRIQGDLDQLRGDIAAVERQTRTLRQQSLRDTLTGLWNRRAYEARVAEEVTRAMRYRFPLSVALWDVDRFTAINQQHGHTTGDLVLQALSGRVLGMLRRSDFLARTDGEEFAVIFTGTDGAQAAVAAEKIRLLVAGTPVDTPAGPIRVTASVGVAGLHPEETWIDLCRRAAQALAAAQADGGIAAVAGEGTGRL
ncbi:MAG TPA: diguanylate cyclase [Deferrisomatales bacterium]|nr:diguanylate cyclase [Deferrisomatales bacterium]